MGLGQRTQSNKSKNIPGPGAYKDIDPNSI
jgi:hypothetical protein